MSLINEALKKAGRDAERSAPRATLTPSPTQVPPRRLSPRVAVLALLVVGAAALFLVLRGELRREAQAVAEPVRTVEARTASAPDPPPPAVVVSEPVDGATEQALQDVTASTPIAAGGPVGDEPPSEDSALRIDLENQEEFAAVLQATENGQPEAAPKRRQRRRPGRPAGAKTTPIQIASSSLDGASFLKRAEIPGGGTLELSGIAWSETQPVAVISGSVVSPGERVKGFKVIRITADSVDLEGANESFTIRLR